MLQKAINRANLDSRIVQNLVCAVSLSVDLFAGDIKAGDVEEGGEKEDGRKSLHPDSAFGGKESL